MLIMKREEHSVDQAENAYQLHHNYAFTKLDSAHSCLPSASLQRTLPVPHALHCGALFRNGAETRQRTVQRRSEAEAVSQEWRN